MNRGPPNHTGAAIPCFSVVWPCRVCAIGACILPVLCSTEEFFDDMANVDGALTLLAIVGIKDPVRKEVPDAVATCQVGVTAISGDF